MNIVFSVKALMWSFCKGGTYKNVVKSLYVGELFCKVNVLCGSSNKRDTQKRASLHLKGDAPGLMCIK